MTSYLFFSDLQSVAVAIPDRLRMASTGRGRNAILVTSPSESIEMHALNRAGTSCGGFLVLPVSGLGRYYHVVSWFPPTQFTQMAVAAVEADTTIQITFPRDDQLEVCTLSSDVIMSTLINVARFLRYCNIF